MKNIPRNTSRKREPDYQKKKKKMEEKENLVQSSS